MLAPSTERKPTTDPLRSQVRRIDAKLDRLYLLINSAHAHLPSPPPPANGDEDADDELSDPLSAETDHAAAAPDHDADHARLARLHRAIRELSPPAAATQALLPRRKIARSLDEATRGLAAEAATAAGHTKAKSGDDLEWLLVGKAAAQVYGHLLAAYLAQLGPISAEEDYWQAVLGSRRGVYYYYLQTAPVRAWRFAQEVLNGCREAVARRRGGGGAAGGWGARWGQYWRMVRASAARQYSLAALQAGLMSPLLRCRVEARDRLRRVQRLRDLRACGLGLLEGEALLFGAEGSADHPGPDAPDSGSDGAAEAGGPEWRRSVQQSVLLMRAALQPLPPDELQRPLHFEDAVFNAVEHENRSRAPPELGPAAMAALLRRLVERDLPTFEAAARRQTGACGRPPRALRYWLPAAAALLAGGAALSLLFRHRASVATWLRDLAGTTRDFVLNWLVDPLRRTIGTIRHDQDSDIALLSKESLQGDRASLERMVVDFARDQRPPPDAAALDTIRARVREGDLTAVLTAYERDLRRPFVGTVRGDLVRTLLIQVQKTKVDVEVAMRGIDNLLSSQELVFACLGLTPGVLISWGALRWLGGLLGAREGRAHRAGKARANRHLLYATRIVQAPRASAEHTLSFTEHGRLLFEMDRVRGALARVLPIDVARDFAADARDLVDLGMGSAQQRAAADRIWRGYWRWLQ